MIKNIIVIIIIIIIIIIARFEYTLTLGLLKFVFQIQTVYLSVKKLICALQAFFLGAGQGKEQQAKGKQKEHLIHLLLPFAFQRKREGGLHPDHKLLRRGHTCTKRPPPPHPSPDMALIRSYNIKTRQVMSLAPLQKIMFCIF